MDRRRFLTASGAVLGTGVLAACGPNRAASPTGSGAGTLRAVWWGNDQRTKNTNAALEAFSKTSGDAAVVGEPTEWSGYWDKLATQLAAKNAPDLVQMDEKFLLEYVDRKALLALNDVATTDFGEGLAELGTVSGTRYAVDAGTIAPVVMLNPTLFDTAKVALPDDSTWTWESMGELARELTSKLPDGAFGLTDFSGRDAAFRVWVRQHGTETFANGKIGFEPGVAADFFALAAKLKDAKATPSASQSAEDVAAAVDQRLFSTGRTAMAIYSSNQITAFDAASKADLLLLRLPSLTGSAKDAQLAYQASMFWTVTAGSPNPAQAQKLVDFLVNSPEAGRLMLTERGIPANDSVLQAIQESLTPSDKKAIDYLEKIKPELGANPPLTPKGGSSFEDTLIRHGQDVLFGRATPQAAATAFVDDMNSAMSK